MNILLRSCLKADKADNEALLFRNYLMFTDSGLGFDVPEDNVVWSYVEEFCRNYNHSPDLVTIRNHFQHIGEEGVVDRLEVIAAYTPIFRGDFESRLNEKSTERKIRTVVEVLKEANSINQIGVEVQEGRDKKLLRGPVDAVRYILDRSHEIVSPTLGARLSGEVTGDAEDFLAEYDRVKSDPLAGIGQMSGIQQMDHAFQGAKRQELWTHAAFTGGLKSTLMLNWAYTQAVYYGHSSYICSLEMPYKQDRRILYSMHSLHEKFNQIRVDLGLQSDLKVPRGLLYQKIRDGVLDDAEEKFLKEYVVPDFSGGGTIPWKHDPDGGYGKIHVEVSDPDKSDFTVADLRSKAEMTYNKSPFSLMFVDHAGLMAPRKWVASTTERLNEVIRDLKRMALSFNRGQGMAVISLFQINREGFKAAEKNGGKYNLTHLSYANEAERSSDIVTTTFVNDELRKRNRVLFQCLKSRDDAPFEPFAARVEWSCRRLLTSFGDNIEQIVGKQDTGKGKSSTSSPYEETGNLIDQEMES